MSNSSRLRETHTAMGGALGIHSAGSVGQEMSMKEAMYRVVEQLREKYPALTFSHSTRLRLSEVAAIQKRCGLGCGEASLAYEDSDIQPDGGFIWVSFNGETHLIASCEAKRQGTNEKRLREGKKKQAKGNAIERAVKNCDTIRNLMEFEPYFPYAIFASGCDFEDGSSIRDRILCTNRFSQINTTYVQNVLPQSRNIQRASLYIRDSHWGRNEIKNVMWKIAVQSVDVIMSKYEHPLAA